MSGYIFLHRKMQENPIWASKPFCKIGAWVDLLLKANWKDRSWGVGNKVIDLKRGQFISSILTMSKEWGWGEQKVSNFLIYLEKNGMIFQERNNKYTKITICNYDSYNDINILIEEQKQNKSRTKAEQKNKPKEDKEENSNIILNGGLAPGGPAPDKTDIEIWWAKWIVYKKEQHKFEYKNEVSLKLAYKRLLELSNNNDINAILIIQEAMASGWKGFYELKTNIQKQTLVPNFIPTEKQIELFNKFTERAKLNVPNVCNMKFPINIEQFYIIRGDLTYKDLSTSKDISIKIPPNKFNEYLTKINNNKELCENYFSPFDIIRIWYFKELYSNKI